VKAISSRPDDPGSRSARRPGIRRGWLDLAWTALSLLNVVAIIIWPSPDTIPFHLLSISFAVLYGRRIWPANPMLWGLGIVIITTFAAIGFDLLKDAGQVEEVGEMPLMAVMFAAVVWHANRRITADYERHLVDEENARLLSAQRRFLQDASHYLRTPVTIALTHAELLARDMAGGEELRDVQVIIGEMARLSRLSERLLVIAGSADPDFLRPEPVALDRFTLECYRKWLPTSSRRWTLGRLDAVLITADRERLGLALDALLENAVRHTATGGQIQLSVLRDRDGRMARMIVADSGEGIAPAELDRIFDRFRSGSQLGGTRGTGLGLALVRAVARAHGGEVRVRSALGEGSEFELVLPVRRPAEGLPAAPDGPAETRPARPAAGALAAGSRPAYASGDPGPGIPGRTTVEEL
jgi:signal transduction histidine kinase